MVSPTVPNTATTTSATNLKRRGSSVQQTNVPKRAKTAEGSQDDAIRKYCLSKLEEFIRPMFEEYRIKEEPVIDTNTTEDMEVEKDQENPPPANEEPNAEGAQNATDPNQTNQRNDDEEANNELEQRVKGFVFELEKCMMTTYAEADKTGKLSAGAKYKYVYSDTN